jgi:putative endonuclease
MNWGEKAEESAADLLLGLGYRIAERNWRAGRRGEIDIIAYDGDVLVFVEVKARKAGSLEGPMEAVTAAKRKKLLGLAREYLYRSSLYGKVDCRFDVIGVTRHPTGREMQHIKDAFRG